MNHTNKISFLKGKGEIHTFFTFLANSFSKTDSVLRCLDILWFVEAELLSLCLFIKD